MVVSPDYRVKLSNTTFTVDLANNEYLREKGLSGREFLSFDHGMLFIFPTSGIYSFWMKEMKFSIDIIWIDQNWKIVAIKPNASPETYPRSFVSASPAKYVLEIPAGTADYLSLKAGDIVSYFRR